MRTKIALVVLFLILALAFYTPTLLPATKKGQQSGSRSDSRVATVVYGPATLAGDIKVYSIHFDRDDLLFHLITNKALKKGERVKTRWVFISDEGREERYITLAE